jgi:starch phosphorylase
LLEREVIPQFYDRDKAGIPTAWIRRMRESMARLTPQFSTNRAVREYTEQHYHRAASAYRKRAADMSEVGVGIVNWRHALDQKWSALRFREVNIETTAERHAFNVQVFLAGLDPDAIQVELYADGIAGSCPVQQEMKLLSPLPDATGCHLYCGSVSAERPPLDYTPRLTPHFVGVAIPLEDSRILWQR